MLAPAFPPPLCRCSRPAVKQRRATPCVVRYVYSNERLVIREFTAQLAQRMLPNDGVRVMRAKKFHPGIPALSRLLAVLFLSAVLFQPCSLASACRSSSRLALFRHARHRALPRRACLDVVARFIPVPYFSYFTRNFLPLSPSLPTTNFRPDVTYTSLPLFINIRRYT